MWKIALILALVIAVLFWNPWYLFLMFEINIGEEKKVLSGNQEIWFTTNLEAHWF